MHEYNSLDYFANLTVLALVFVPLFFACRAGAARGWVLALLGALMLFLVAPRVLLFYLAYWALIFAFQGAVARLPEGRARRTTFWAAVAAALSPMLAWKLWPVPFHDLFNLAGHDLLFRLWPALGELDATRAIIVPIGISFTAFRAIDLLAKTELEMAGIEPAAHRWAYALFPSVQLIGPIAEYDEVARELQKPRAFQWDDIATGTVRILAGLFKAYGLGYWLADTAGILRHHAEASTPALWLGVFGYAIYFYLNFSGSSDIAIGVARLFGVRLRENFDSPFFATNIAAYWSRWHMSLSRFAQRYIYLGLGGFRKERQYLAIFCTMMVIALWHAPTLGYVAFGVYHGTALCLHRWLLLRRGGQRILPPGWAVPAAVLTFVFVSLAFPILALPSAQLPAFYLALAGLR